MVDRCMRSTYTQVYTVLLKSYAVFEKIIIRYLDNVCFLTFVKVELLLLDLLPINK